MSDRPEALGDAIQRLIAAEGEDLPSPEDLVAYREGRLEEPAAEAVERALALNPEAAQEYLDLANFSHLEAPGEEHRISDEDVQGALASIQDRIAREEASSQIQAESPTEMTARRTSRRMWLPALAASLILVVSGIWIARLQQQLTASSAPRFAAVVDVHPTRGERPSPISRQAVEVMLVFHDVQLGAYSQGWLEITASDGRQVLAQEVQPSADESSLLYLALPRSQLPYGKYQVEIHGLRDRQRHLVQEYALNLAAPDETPPL